MIYVVLCFLAKLNFNPIEKSLTNFDLFIILRFRDHTLFKSNFKAV